MGEGEGQEWKSDWGKAWGPRATDLMNEAELYVSNIENMMGEEKRRHAARQQEYAQRKAKLDEREEELDKYEKKLEEKKEIIQKSGKKLLEIRENLDARQKELEAAYTELEQKKKELEQERAALEEDRAKYEKAEQLSAEAAEKETYLDKKKTELEQKEKALLEKEGQLEEEKGKLKKSYADFEKTTKDYAELEKKGPELEERERRLTDLEIKLAKKEEKIKKAYEDLEKQRAKVDKEGDVSAASQLEEMVKDVQASRARLVELEEALEEKQVELAEKEKELERRELAQRASHPPMERASAFVREMERNRELRGYTLQFLVGDRPVWIARYLAENLEVKKRVDKEYGILKKTPEEDEEPEPEKPRKTKKPKKAEEPKKADVLDEILGSTEKENFEEEYFRVKKLVDEYREEGLDVRDAEKALTEAAKRSKGKVYKSALGYVEDAEKALKKAEEEGPYSESIRLEGYEVNPVKRLLEDSDFVEGKHYDFTQTGRGRTSLVSRRKDLTELVHAVRRRKAKERGAKKKAKKAKKPPLAKATPLKAAPAPGPGKEPEEPIKAAPEETLTVSQGDYKKLAKRVKNVFQYYDRKDKDGNIILSGPQDEINRMKKILAPKRAGKKKK